MEIVPVSPKESPPTLTTVPLTAGPSGLVVATAAARVETLILEATPLAEVTSTIEPLVSAFSDVTPEPLKVVAAVTLKEGSLPLACLTHTLLGVLLVLAWIFTTSPWNGPGVLVVILISKADPLRW